MIRLLSVLLGLLALAATSACEEDSEVHAPDAETDGEAPLDADLDAAGEADAGDGPADAGEPSFPVTPSVLVSGAFQRCEGIAFNGEGELYVAGDRHLWRVSTEGEVFDVAGMYSNLGLAPIGERDLLAADFGPLNAFDNGPNNDGIVWRTTPEGEQTALSKGIGDPNFVAVREDGVFLVSDDAVDEIWLVDAGGATQLFTQAIDHPNGLAFSADGSTLYVAQIFTSLSPLTWDRRIWRLPLADGQPAGEPEVLAEAGVGPDGLALDELGRVYAAANFSGEITRIDPQTGASVVVAEGLPGVASLAFGRGDFDHHAIYATSTQTGEVSVVPVGVAGMPLHR